MLYKNYLITALSIIETIFAFLVKKSNLWKMQRWQKVKEGSINFENVKPEIVDGKKYKTDTQRYIEIEPVEAQMDFIDLLQSVRDNHLISTISDKNWKFLQKFYKKRNRVHIRITENVSTEYNDFEEIDYLNAKILLKLIIFDTNVIKDKESAKKYLDFLFLTDEEKDRFQNYH